MLFKGGFMLQAVHMKESSDAAVSHMSGLGKE